MDLGGYLTSLSALRTLDMPTYFALVAEQGGADYEQIIERVREHCAGRADDAPAAEANYFRSEEYEQFDLELSRAGTNAAMRAKRMLRRYGRQAYLRELRDRDHEQYLAELTPIGADELAQALIRGTIVNAIDIDGKPMAIRSDENFSGAFMERPVATAVVDGDVLSEVLHAFATHRDDVTANPQGLRMCEVVIRGGLNLNWLRCDFPLGFEGCDFYGWLSADYAQVPWLSFDTCDFTPIDNAIGSNGALNAASIKVETELRFWECRGFSQLFLPGASIGSFSPRDEQFEDTGNPENGGGFRTVIDGATFGELIVPIGDSHRWPFELDSSVRIHKLEVGSANSGQSAAKAAAAVYSWLIGSGKASGPNENPPGPGVITELEGALTRAGRPDVAVELGILAADRRTYHEGWQGRAKRFFLRHTVRYFYDNLLAIRWLAGILALAWLTALFTAFAAPEQLVQSPLANPSSVPKGWFDGVADRVVWSFLFAVDLVLSPLSLGQTQALWPRSPWLSLLFATYKGAALLLLGLFVTGITGLAEQRSRR